MKLSVIKPKENKILFTTSEVNGSSSEFVPVYHISPNKDRETVLKFRTGSDISEIPSCVNSLFQ